MKARKTPCSDRTPGYEARNANIRCRYAEGETVANLARDFGISVQRIHQILHGRRK